MQITQIEEYKLSKKTRIGIIPFVHSFEVRSSDTYNAEGNRLIIHEHFSLISQCFISGVINIVLHQNVNKCQNVGNFRNLQNKLKLSSKVPSGGQTWTKHI